MPERTRMDELVVRAVERAGGEDAMQARFEAIVDRRPIIKRDLDALHRRLAENPLILSSLGNGG